MYISLCFKRCIQTTRVFIDVSISSFQQLHTTLPLSFPSLKPLLKLSITLLFLSLFSIVLILPTFIEAFTKVILFYFIYIYIYIFYSFLSCRFPRYYLIIVIFSIPNALCPRHLTSIYIISLLITYFITPSLFFLLFYFIFKLLCYFASF